MANVDIRRGGASDALPIAALATYVFFDTYCAEGLRVHLAREAFSHYSEPAFAERLETLQTRFLLAHSGDALLAFAELALGTSCPLKQVKASAELVRLYVHPAFQGCGIGTKLLDASLQLCSAHGAEGFWLSAWSGNARALAFYAARGLRDVGLVQHVIDGVAYENRVLVAAV